MNRLYYADNLDALREHVADESIDLVYLDPPFNSNASYNILFRSPTGAGADAQIEAFEDTWHWNDKAEDAFDQVMRSGRAKAFELLNAMRSFLGENDLMAYLAMMAVRLIELHRVLKPTGSLYLHCDPTASHYLKMLLDGIFGPANYLNEITWKRTTAHNDAGKFGRNTDIILFYSKGPKRTWNPIHGAYDEAYVARFRNRDPDGRLWMDDNLTAKGLSGGGYTYEYKGCTSLWRVPPETMARLDREGRLHFTRAGGIRLKRYLDEAKGVPLQALWTISRRSIRKRRSGSAIPPRSRWPCSNGSSPLPRTRGMWCSTRSAAAEPPSMRRKSWAGIGSASMSPISPSPWSRKG